MERPHPPDFIDTRIVLRVYAALCLLAGVALLALSAGGGFRGPSQAVAGRAAVLLAAACAAMGLARVESPRDRHDALAWFANGHLVLLAALLAMSLLRGGPRTSEVYLPFLAAATMLLYYFWQTGDGHRARESAESITLFPHGPRGNEHLRSEYEERIREAAAQEERHRLARELHDSVKQQIFAIQTAAATVQARYDADPPGASEALGRLRAYAREAMTEMEAMLDSLRASPLESAGLVEAIKRQAEALRFRTGAEVAVEIGELPRADEMPPGVAQGVFRVAQEAFANVARHARARAVKVRLLVQGNALVLSVADDGAGFEPAAATAAGMGLTGMGSRAEALNGRLTVTTRPGAGTTVTIRVPLGPRARPDISDYRRRAVTWGACSLLQGLLVAWRVATGQPVGYAVAVLAVFVVVTGRACIGWRRARRSAESSRWIQSPSHS
ncbi:MAG TPA: sensor histidine kinase [Vicinamibacterales bacterium]|nr:sensor histidine kinase [Vicinamibacterales bacterium]